MSAQSRRPGAWTTAHGAGEPQRGQNLPGLEPAIGKHPLGSPPWGGTRRLVAGAPGGPQHGNRLPGVTEPVGWPAAGEEGGAGRRVGARQGGGTAPAKGRDRNGQGVCSGWGGAVKLGWALDVQNSGDGPTRLAAGPRGSRGSRPTRLPDRRPGGGLGSQPLSCQLDHSGVRGAGWGRPCPGGSQGCQVLTKHLFIAPGGREPAMS